MPLELELCKASYCPLLMQVQKVDSLALVSSAMVLPHMLLSTFLALEFTVREEIEKYNCIIH